MKSCCLFSQDISSFICFDAGEIFGTSSTFAAMYHLLVKAVSGLFQGFVNVYKDGFSLRESYCTVAVRSPRS